MVDHMQTICRREIRNENSQKGCEVVLLSNNTIQYEFKAGKGKPPFYIPYEVVEKEVEELKKVKEQRK